MHQRLTHSDVILHSKHLWHTKQTSNADGTRLKRSNLRSSIVFSCLEDIFGIITRSSDVGLNDQFERG